MDTVTQSKCERPGQAHVRRMLHLSIWMLLLLFVLTSSTDTQVTGKVTVSKCIGEDAAFWWNYTVTPFYAVEWYFGKTLIATLEESHPQDFLKINNSYKHRFHRLLEENRIGFNLTNVTKNDEGDYTCKLNLKSTSILVEQKGTLNVRDIIHGNLNIICDHNICTCGNPNRSGAYSWVFHDGVGRSETLNTNRSQLNVTGIAKNGSFHCVRHSDCQRSGCFHFTSDIIHGNLNIICDHNICTCGNPNSSGVYSWVFHDGVDRSETLNTNRLELNVTGMAKNRSFHCVRHSDCQRSGCFHFTSTQPCRRRGRALDSMAYCRCDEDEPESGTYNSEIHMVKNSPIPLVKNSPMPLVKNSPIPLVKNSPIPLILRHMFTLLPLLSLLALVSSLSSLLLWLSRGKTFQRLETMWNQGVNHRN
ncbi:uncharacterized protein [Haliotis asinina]|uniref:uncharacterized protein n=1 Tax=Haliotis asinina TaxID=109174 RepID=UPI003531F637